MGWTGYKGPRKPGTEQSGSITGELMKLHDVPQALSERVMDYVVSTWNTRLLIYHANCLMSWDWSTRLLIYHAKYRKSWDCSTWLLIYHANCFKSWDWKEGLAFTIPQEVFGNPTAPRAGFSLVEVVVLQVDT